ncbi:hypothetical protein JCM9279_002981 [Rhodotorula babjevae]
MHSLESVREEDEGPSSSTPTSSSSSSALHSAAQQRAHARQHSRIHERNLSAFFPRPGQVAQGYGDTYVDPHAASNPLGSPPVADIPSASSPSGASQDPFVVSPPKTRRGHHHRHSVSHNLFPFLDPAAPPPPPGTAHLSSASSPSSTRPPDDAQLPALTSSFRTRTAHLPLPLRFLLFATTALPLPSRALLALALLQVALGATLWVQGQAAESLAVTGLGYLVVFDGVGALSSVLLEQEGALERTLGALGSGKNLTIRRPYGPARLVTLSHFSQAVYLLFSAVYVCKESVEHVLLLHGPHDAEGAHGAGHGGVGHGEGLAVLGEGHGDSIALPTRALFLSAACAVTLALFARNHAGLSHALSRRAATSSSKPSAAQLALGPPAVLTALVNPFTATVLLFSVGLLGAAVVLPPAQLAPVDKVVALLESAAMFYVAQPAASATGHVLLQTSPGKGTAAVRAVEGLVSELEALPAISSVDPPHIWQLSSSTSSLSPSSSSSSSSSAAPPTPGPTLIATLTLHAHPHATDAERLAVTQHVRERVKRANERLRDRGRGEGEVEVCVQVKRG